MLLLFFAFVWPRFARVFYDLLTNEIFRSINVLYRDLKPRNLMMSNDGHVCLTDFGLCKQLLKSNNWLTTGKAGTMGYRAPEVLNNGTYGISCDFFGLGVTIYRLMTGRTPFGKQGNDFDRPLKYYHLSPVAQDLIGALLLVDVGKRLGCAHSGSERGYRG
jgi:serine/threonine protein kinase